MLRRGWPDACAGVYVEEELHKAVVIDVASEAVEHYQEQERLRMVGARSDAILFQFGANAALERVPLGELADRVIAHVRTLDRPALEQFTVTNRAGLNEFWGRSKGDALEAKRAIEARETQLAAGDAGENAAITAP